MSPSTTDGELTARALYGEDQETREVPLAGAQGLSLEDQRAIDRAVDAGCAASVLTNTECRLASRSRLERIRAIRAEQAAAGGV